MNSSGRQTMMKLRRLLGNVPVPRFDAPAVTAGVLILAF